MKWTLIIILSGFCGLLFSGCRQDIEHGPLGQPSGRPPEPVSNIQIENLPGAVRLTYQLSSNDDLLYVLAVYSLPSGEQQAKASVYSNIMLLQGFPEAKSYVVKLYSVNKWGIRSKPVTITVSPTTPPLQDVFKSLSVQPDFGGINISLINALQRGYVICTLIKDSANNWKLYDQHYSTLDTMSYSIRGLDSVETQFGIYLTDQWGNHSDTLLKTLKPIYEIQLDKSLWKLVSLPSDFSVAFYPWSTIDHLWDNNIHESSGTFDYYYASPTAGETLPNWFTIDLGGYYRLSRLRVYQYEGAGQYMYTDGNPRVYEIWSNTEAVDSWDSWKLLLHCVSIKPSGLPLGERSAEDVEYAIQGENYTFPLTDTMAVRYIRFKLIDTWSGQPNMLCDEISLWGQKK